MTDSNVHRIERVAENVIERTEEVVANVMRTMRDEKKRLDTVTEEQAKQIADLNRRLVEQDERHDKQRERLSEDRDRYLKRAIQLETDLRATVAVLNDALNAKVIVQPQDDGEPAPRFLTESRNPFLTEPRA